MEKINTCGIGPAWGLRGPGRRWNAEFIPCEHGSESRPVLWGVDAKLRVSNALALVMLSTTGCGDDTASASGGDTTDTDASATTESFPSTTGAVDTSSTNADTDPPDTDDPSDTEDPPETTGSCPPPSEGTPPPTECARDCGSNGFDFEHLSGINYAGRLVHQLSPTCEGPSCPAPLDAGSYGDEPIGRCEDSAEAQASPRGPEAYCRLSPLVSTFGLELGLTGSPEPTSVTEFRPRLDGSAELEPYVWHTGIVRLEGPLSRFAGRWEAGTVEAWDRVEGRNLTCIENLEALGIPYDEDALDAACSATRMVDGVAVPLRMQMDGVVEPTPGLLDGRTSSCSSPSEGPDTCCTSCDEQLSVRVARYGVGEDGERRSPNAETAIACDPGSDRLMACRDFVAEVDRRDELVRHRYTWDGCTSDWPLPLEDRLRQTHPDERPSDSDVFGASCSSSDECESGLECIGVDSDGNACSQGAGCDDRVCRLEWFGDCQETEAGDAFCVDRRFRLRSAGACFIAEQDFEGGGVSQPAGARLAECGEMDGALSPEACCQDALGNEASCDPFFQSDVRPVELFDRTPEMGPPECICDESQTGACESLVEELCEPPLGDGMDPAGGSPPGTYAYREVRRRGGTRFSQELGGFELRLATLGGLTRAGAEACAESSNTIDEQGPTEAWRAHANFVPELDRNYSVAICSGQTYSLVFAGPEDPQYLRSTGGDTLAGKQRYTVETSDFLIIPGSGFPTDNLNIGQCDDFSIRVSNAFDLSVDNLRKPMLWRVEDVDGEPTATERIAGGRDCDPDATAGDVAMGAIPCLEVDPENFLIGEISVRLNAEQFPDVLQVGERYRLVLPGLDDLADASDPDAYADAFHDACGVPLLTGDLPELEYAYDFTIDGPCNF